jgi:peptidoglycan L-alanyl-D-glutamate endopeptidase CwlK
MSYTLSSRSLSKLEGVHESLVSIVKEAITLTKVDFGVICGTRTKTEQAELVKKGASKTMNSRHLPQASTGKSHAVDLMAYVGSRASWELNLYDDIADAIKAAAVIQGHPVTWGGAWHKQLNDWDGSSEDLMNEYIDTRRSQGRKPFIDGPHFQLEIN